MTIFDDTDPTKRRLQSLGEGLFRRLRDRGLATTAEFARRLLGLSAPESWETWTDWERETWRRLLARLCAYPGAQLPSPRACEALEETLGFLVTLPEGRLRQLHRLLAILEAGSLVTGPDGQRRRFSRLDAACADTYLESWARSELPPRRAAFQALKSVCMMGYWSRPDTWDGIGYDLESNPGLDTSSDS